MQWFREKFGAVVVSVIIGLISLVFIFYGVFSPRSTRGMHDGAVAGTVNGESISIREYQQSLNQRLEFFRNMAGGKISEEQLKAFRIHEAVFQDLARRKLMIQEAQKEGLAASDEEVKQAILDIPAFQKSGKFDLMTYKKVLEANAYSPGTFEKTVRDDLSAQRWGDYFRRRVVVSDEEAKREYLISRDKRNVKYVVLTAENGRKGLASSPAEVQKFLADSANLNLAKAQFEEKKQLEFKGKTFEQARDAIARDLLASGKLAEVQKINDRLADEILPFLKADKASDAKVNALLKAYGAEVRTTGFFNQMNAFVPGLGDAKELLADAFAEKSPIDPAQGGKAKKYSTASARIVAVIVGSQRSDLSKFESEREGIVRQVALRKQKELFDSWMGRVTKSAKIDMNPSIVQDES